MPPLDDDSPRLGRVAEGFFLTLAQVLLACVVGIHAAEASPFDKPSELLKFRVFPADLFKAYFNLVQWDSQWYWAIAQDGYRTDGDFRGKTGNVAFFPGYPLAVRAVHAATAIVGTDPRLDGLRWRLSLLVVAQMAAWAFWTYWLLLLDRYDVPPLWGRAATLCLWAQPGAFFLIAGYSESLFLASLLGMIYWWDGDSRAGPALAALHGLLMTATRLVGVPLVIVPLLRMLVGRRTDDSGRSFPIALATAAVASLGAVGFFVYCWRAHGAWDLYFTSQQTGWGVKPNYLAFFDASTYRLPRAGLTVDGFLSPDWLSRAHVPAFLALLVAVAVAELTALARSPAPTWHERIALGFAAAAMFFVAATGLFGNEYRSMLRYVHGSEALLLLHAGHFTSSEDLDSGATVSVAGMGLVAIAALVVQIAYVYRFTHGLWVA